jgi:type IV secretion system protein VirD4
MSNTSSVFFGVNEIPTATHISDRLGEATIVVDSGGTNGGGSRQHSSQDASTSSTDSWGNNANWSQQSRKLLKPEEVIALSPRTAITFTPGVPPILTTLTRYYEEGGVGNGRWKRLRWLAEVWFAAIALLALTATAAFVLSQVQFPQSR